MRLKDTKEVVEMIKRIEAGGGGGGETEGYEYREITEDEEVINLWDLEPKLYAFVGKPTATRYYLKYGPEDGNRISCHDRAWVFITDTLNTSYTEKEYVVIYSRFYIYSGRASSDGSRVRTNKLDLELTVKDVRLDTLGEQDYVSSIAGLQIKGNYYRIQTPGDMGYTVTLKNAYDSGTAVKIEDEYDTDMLDILWGEYDYLDANVPTTLVFDTREETNGGLSYFTIESMQEVQDGFDIVAKNSAKSVHIEYTSDWYITVTQNS